MEANEAMERFERSEVLAEARERFGRHAAVLVAILGRRWQSGAWRQ